MLAIADRLRQCANLCCTMNLLSAAIELIAVLTMRFFFFLAEKILYCSKNSTWNWGETKRSVLDPSLTKAWETREGRLEMGIGPNQFTRVAHWASKCADTLPFLWTKENSTFEKQLAKNKISSRIDLILQCGVTSDFFNGLMTFQASPSKIILWNPSFTTHLMAYQVALASPCREFPLSNSSNHANKRLLAVSLPTTAIVVFSSRIVASKFSLI